MNDSNDKNNNIYIQNRFSNQMKSLVTYPILRINVNGDLQSWLDDESIITEATLPENFRRIISGPRHSYQKD